MSWAHDTAARRCNAVSALGTFVTTIAAARYAHRGVSTAKAQSGKRLEMRGRGMARNLPIVRVDICLVHGFTVDVCLVHGFTVMGKIC